jgi:TonB family protein
MLVPATESVRAPEVYLGTLLQEALTAFQPPDTITSAVGGVVSMWLHADGRLSDVRAADTVLPVNLVNALRLAIDSMVRRGGIGPVLPQPTADSIPLHLIMHWAAERTPLSVPVMRLQPPIAYHEFQVDTPALNVGKAFPSYPTHLRESYIEGEVLVEFNVDTIGRADMKLLRVLKSSPADFTRAVREVLPRMRFSPAELDGCRVRQIVQMPFAFKINR